MNDKGRYRHLRDRPAEDTSTPEASPSSEIPISIGSCQPCGRSVITPDAENDHRPRHLEEMGCGIIEANVLYHSLFGQKRFGRLNQMATKTSILLLTPGKLGRGSGSGFSIQSSGKLLTALAAIQDGRLAVKGVQ